jgi:bifunctional non-homologous end joining protein LigD
MTLNEYQKKRRFGVTPEPSGKGKKPKEQGSDLVYVIQKHRATSLHYDFRLEWHGTLLSWAVPKGPSLDPSVKRLAMQVEDHPIDYAGFEGVIPEGEYGGGTVMVWDNGTWEPEVEDVDAALQKGDLKFTLHGRKLKGSWVLVRTRGYGRSSDKSWLLIARDGGGDVERAATGDPSAKSSKQRPPAKTKLASATPKRRKRAT